MKRSFFKLFLIGVLVLLAGITVYQVWRGGAPVGPPLEAEPPRRDDELASINLGFSGEATKAGKRLFSIDAETAQVLEGGVQLLSAIHRLKLYREDGTFLTIEASRGRVLDQGGDRGIRVVVEGGVRVSDEAGVSIETERLEYDSQSGLVTAPRQATLQSSGNVAVLQSARLFLNRHNLEVHGGLELTTAEKALRVLGHDANYDADAAVVEFVDPFTASQFGLALTVAHGHMALPRKGRDAQLVADGPMLVSGLQRDARWQIAAPSMQFEISAAEGKRTMLSEGPVSWLFEGTDTNGPRGFLHAGAWRAELAEQHEPVIELSGGVQGTWIDAGPSAGPLRLSAERVGLLGKHQGARFEIERIQGQGAARLQGEDLEISGDDLSWALDQSGVLLAGGAPATASQGRNMLRAPKLIVDRKQQTISGSGGIDAEVVRERGEGLLGDDSPIRIRAGAATIPKGDGWAVFSGKAKAWQAESQLDAETIRFQRRGQLLTAEGKVVLLRHAGSDDRRLRVSAEQLDYDATRRVAHLHRSALIDQPEPAARVRADEMDLSFDGSQQISSVIATGSATLNANDVSGSADRMEWSGGNKGSVLLIGEQRFATLAQGSNPPLKGQRLRYDLASGKFSADGGLGKTVIEGETSAPKSGPKKKP